MANDLNKWIMRLYLHAHYDEGIQQYARGRFVRQVCLTNRVYDFEYKFYLSKSRR